MYCTRYHVLTVLYCTGACARFGFLRRYALYNFTTAGASSTFSTNMMALAECPHRVSPHGHHHVQNQEVINGNLEVLAKMIKKRRGGNVEEGATAMASMQQLVPHAKPPKKISARHQNCINENLKVLGSGRAQFEVLIYGARGSKSLGVYSANQSAIARNIDRLAKYLEKDPCTRVSLDQPFVELPYPDTRDPAQLCCNQFYINFNLMILARGLDEMSQPNPETQPKLPKVEDASKRSCIIL